MMVDLQFADPELAAFYDALSPRHERWDFDFYRPLAMGAASVLDVGCGTGTFLREVRDAGHEGRLCGLDPAPGMIARARRTTGVEWRQGDFSSTVFDEAFEFIVMTGHAFQVLLSDDAIMGLLRAVRHTLVAGGRFAFETRNPEARAWERWEKHRLPSVFTADGHKVDVTCRIEKPFDGHCISFTYTYASDAWPKPFVSWSTLRFVDAATLNALLGAAGLRVLDQFGDWDRSPVTPTSPEIISLVAPA